MSHSHAPGDFCWFELATSDQPAANQFYTSLFGWTVTDSPISDSETYSMYKLAGEDVGAAYTMRPEQRDQGVPPNWLLYVAVPDVEQSIARVERAGGTVLSPAFDVREFGRMAVLRDPQGAVFAVWQAKQHAGTGVTGVPGTACWGELSTPDQANGGRFYADVFGWQMVSGKDMTPASPGDYYHIVNGAQMIGGVAPPHQRDPNAPPHWLVYFAVTDCAAATRTAISLGATAYLDSMDVGDEGIVSVIADPQGAVFGLHQAK